MKKIILAFLLSVFFLISIVEAKDQNLIVNIISQERDQDGMVAVDVLFEGETVDLFGVAFHLKFDSSVVEFQNYQAGDLFEVNDLRPMYLVREGDQGELIVGVSLRRGDALAVSKGKLLRFVFSAKLRDDLGLKLDQAEVFVWRNNQVEKLDNVQWQINDDETVSVFGKSDIIQLSAEKYQGWLWVFGGLAVALILVSIYFGRAI